MMTDSIPMTSHLDQHFQHYAVHDDGQSTLPAERHNLTMQIERIGSEVVFTTDCPVAAFYCDYEVVQESLPDSEEARYQTFTVDAESFDLLVVFEDNVIANLYRIKGNTLTSQIFTGETTRLNPLLEVPRLFDLPEDVEPSLAAAFDSPSCITALSAQLTLAADQEEPYQADQLRVWWGSLAPEIQRQWMHHALSRIEFMFELWDKTLEDYQDEDLLSDLPVNRDELVNARIQRLAADRADLHNFLQITQDLTMRREIHRLDAEIDITWFQVPHEPKPFYCPIIAGAVIDWYQNQGITEDIDPWWDILADDTL